MKGKVCQASKSVSLLWTGLDCSLLSETHTSLMSRKKVNVCKVVLKDAGVALNRAEKFIAERTDEICFHEKLSLEVVIYFVY